MTAERIITCQRRRIVTGAFSSKNAARTGQPEKFPQSIYEAARDKARALAETPEYEVASQKRKKVEMLFAHLKRNLNFRELRLRGPTGVKQEFLLAAIAQNLRKMVILEEQT